MRPCPTCATPLDAGARSCPTCGTATGPWPGEGVQAPPPPGDGTAGYGGGLHAEPDADARTWGMLAHLSGLVLLMGIPSFLGPLVVWLLKRQEHPSVDAHGKEALNFHLSVLLYAVVLGTVTAVLMLLLVGLLLLPVLAAGFVAVLVLTVLGALRANEGRPFRYPLTIRFVR